MRMLIRCSLLLLVLALAGVPVLAAPLSLSAHPVTAAPAAAGVLATAFHALAVGLGFAVFGITIRKDTATLAGKFVQRASAAAGDYTDGVKGAGGAWEAATQASESAYEQGVQQAMADKRFGRGVSGSAGKYQANAEKLGAQRYSPGVQNAKEAWARGVEPALSALKSLNLPPRGPRRSPQNMARANAVAVALGALKTAK